MENRCRIVDTSWTTRRSKQSSGAAEAYSPIARPECIPLEIATIDMIRGDLLSSGLVAEDEIERHRENVRAGVLDLSQPPMISVRGCKPAIRS